jgi:hypothetical protein
MRCATTRVPPLGKMIRKPDGPAAARLAGALQPEQRKRQAIFDGVRGLAVANAQYGPLHRPSAKDAARIISRE